MRSYELYYSFTRTDIRYYVNVVTQPWYRKAIADVYFWYEMHIHKVPGFKKLLHWDSKRKFKKHGFPVLTICDNQSAKHHFLYNQDKKILATFEVDYDTYLRLGGPESTPKEVKA